MILSKFLAAIVCMFALTMVVPAMAADDDAADADKEAETAPTSSAPTATHAKEAGTKNKPGVLDFEAELIEGERKSPDLFLQLQSGTPNLDAIMFQRTNFNDFHNIEKRRRPLYRRYVK